MKHSIVPSNEAGVCLQATLSDVTKEQIVKVLGFEPNIQDDPYKVENSWGFTIDGEPAGIWDWKGSHLFNSWSVYNLKVLELFKNNS